MRAILIGEQIIQVFVIKTNGQDLFVTWNRENHTENNPDALCYIPEYIVEDNNEVELEQGCQDWLDAVEAVKEWIVKYKQDEALQE